MNIDKIKQIEKHLGIKFKNYEIDKDENLLVSSIIYPEKFMRVYKSYAPEIYNKNLESFLKNPFRTEKEKIEISKYLNEYLIDKLNYKITINDFKFNLQHINNIIIILRKKKIKKLKDEFLR